MKDETCKYGLTELPEGVVLMLPENTGDESILKWSGKYPIPQIGQSVTIKMNQLGTGKVESYFTEHGYCGVTVRLDKEPQWKLIQHKNTEHAGIAMVFGLEVELNR